jgi:uncharacterized protein (TIGR03067 family)
MTLGGHSTTFRPIRGRLATLLVCALALAGIALADEPAGAPAPKTPPAKKEASGPPEGKGAKKSADPETGVVPKELRGTWKIKSMTVGGREMPAKVIESFRLKMTESAYELRNTEGVDKGNLKVNETAKPHRIDIIGLEGPNKGKTFLAIHERSGETLRICYDLTGKAHPKEFESPKGSLVALIEYVKAEE